MQALASFSPGSIDYPFQSFVCLKLSNLRALGHGGSCSTIWSLDLAPILGLILPDVTAMSALDEVMIVPDKSPAEKICVENIEIM